MSQEASTHSGAEGSFRSYDDFLTELSAKCEANADIPKDLYAKYDVKKGLRDSNGKGVVAGLTNISKVCGYTVDDGGNTVPCPGRLIYRGFDVKDLVGEAKGLGLFERCAYLLLFGSKPTDEQLTEFRKHLGAQFSLPTNFVKEVIMRDNGTDVMNGMARGTLSLALYEDIGDTSPKGALRNSINIIASMPALAVYGHQVVSHLNGEGFHILSPDPKLTIAENILRMLHPQGEYTELEAVVLDRMMVLHMEHGGGNNSAFTARVVSSSGSDTYSVIAAALLSLKGPKHGGASLKVAQMAKNIKENVEDITDESQMKHYLEMIADGYAFDGKGLVYGMGHAVYTVSDPRAELLRNLAGKLAKEKGREAEYRMYNLIEELSPSIVRERHPGGPVCANVDLYSGFAYDLLGIPEDLYTPMFAVSRTVGWCAHHLEEIISSNKIIRPAYVSIVTEHTD